MWFLLIEIFLLITVSFFAGAGVTALSLRKLVPSADIEASETSGAAS